MFDQSGHQKEINLFLSQLGLIQQQMLNMELNDATKRLDQFYKITGNYFGEITKQLENEKKGQPLFLVKKQIQLLLKNIKILREENKKLPGFTDKEIIQYFEKQLKFKKILKRQIIET